MLKRTLKKILQDTTDKLNLTLLENRQLRERLSEFEKQNASGQIEELSQTIIKLTDENENLRTGNENKLQEYEFEIQELEERNNSFSMQLNKLKGELFDTKKYAEDLKIKLESMNTDIPTNKEILQNIPEPPPTPDVVTAEEKDETSFKYASGIISEAVIHTAAITSRLSVSSDKNANELKALAMGRCELLKSDVLQTVMSDMIIEAKIARMDKLLKEAMDYLDGILGQLTE